MTTEIPAVHPPGGFGVPPSHHANHTRSEEFQAQHHTAQLQRAEHSSGTGRLPQHTVPQKPVSRPNPQFFVDQKRGELHELKLLLRQLPTERDVTRQREVLKKVIAYMTVGMDVSRLFSEMVMLSSTTDMVQKKMVYLYLTNYAETNPSLSILAVNAFQKDCSDHDPRLRGLAIRSLCSLRVPEMIEYIEPALRKGLTDNHPYVRRVCVMGLVKLWRLMAERADVECHEENDDSLYHRSGLVAALKKALYDADAQVAVNAIHALNEIEADSGGVLVTRGLMTSFLNRMKRFNEWGQCAVLNLLVSYTPETEEERFDILNILDDRLKSSSAAVVLGCTRCFLLLTKHDPVLLDQALARLAPPLLTLVTTSCVELAYPVLQHILLILETGNGAAFARVLESEYEQFFCRYSDPSYVKSVKLEILTAITAESNVSHVLQELKECVSDADISVGRQIIRCMGLIALQVPSSVDEVVELVLSLLEHEVDYVTGAAFTVIRDILRKYRHVIEKVAESVESYGLDVSGADMAAVLWIIGEFGDSIRTAPHLLEVMVERFSEEEPSVQLELLTACTKIFFSRPGEVQPILGSLLQQALNENISFDVRDRALFIYRLIDADIVTSVAMELSEALMEEFNTLAVTYRQPSAAFLTVDPLPFCGRRVNKTRNRYSRNASAGSMPRVPDGFAQECADGVYDAETNGHGSLATAQQSDTCMYSSNDVTAPEETEADFVVASTSAQLKFLQTAQLNTSDFQRLWEDAPSIEITFLLKDAPNSELFSDAAEAALSEISVFLMASGVVEDGVVKMFLYARSETMMWFLCELLLLSESAMIKLQIRSSSSLPPNVLREFGELLIEQLERKRVVFVIHQ